MDNTKDVKLTELELQQQEFEEQVKKNKQAKFNKIVKLSSICISIFSVAVFVFVLISFLFVGMSNVFDANFSLVGLYWWLDSLPVVSIVNPEALLAQFILGVFFLLFYIILFGVFVWATVKLIKHLICLSDIAINEMNPLHIALDITRLCISVISFVLLFVLASSSTNFDSLPNITIFCLIFFCLLVLAEVVLKILYVFYDETAEKFKIKELAIYATKKALLIFIPLLMIILFSMPHFGIFIDNLVNYYNDSNAVFSAQYAYELIFPFVKFLFDFIMYFLFISIIRFGCYDLCTGTYVYFGKRTNHNIKTVYLGNLITKSIGWIIFFASLILLVDGLYTYSIIGFRGGFEDYLALIFRFASVILMCVSIKFIDKQKAKFPAKIIH